MEEPVLIMPCLDMRNGRVVKGVHFVDIADAGDPVECARAYCAAGADELALLDVVRRVSEVCTVPFTVGGGISDVKSAELVLRAGANKVSTSSAAFRKPEIIPAMIREFGAAAVTVAIDVDVNKAMPSGYEVYIDGGRTATGCDALEWAKRVDGYGVQVILPTSKAGDGAKTGYDLPVIRAMAEVCKAKIVASGGAGKMEHFLDAVKAGAQILLAASVGNDCPQGVWLQEPLRFLSSVCRSIFSSIWIGTDIAVSSFMRMGAGNVYVAQNNPFYIVFILLSSYDIMLWYVTCGGAKKVRGGVKTVRAFRFK